MQKPVEVVGVYTVESDSDVHMIELIINTNPKEIGIEKIVQEKIGQPKDQWQAAYDEHYLNDNGTAVIGDFIKVPQIQSDTTRIAFFMYYIDFEMPLLSKFGEVKLLKPQAMPDRLKNIIEFESAD